MATREKPKTGAMKGGVRRPRGKGGTWSFPIYLGEQTAQRCPACTAAKKRPSRWWVGAKRLAACPNCGGELVETREPRQVTEGGFLTRRDAETARAKAILRLGRGTFRPPEKMTLAEYLRDVWLPDVLASKLDENTKQGYERTVRDYLIGPADKPHPLGLVELRRLSPLIIRDFYRDHLMKGYTAEDYIRTGRSRRVRDRKTGGWQRGLVDRPGISYSTVKHVQAALHKALSEAVEMGLLETNPATGAVKKNKLGKDDAPGQKVRAWDADELATFLTSTEGSEDYPLWRLVALTGLRRSEALGLKEEDLRPEVPSILIRRVRVPLQGGQVEEKPRTKNGTHREVLVDRETMEELQAMLRRRRGNVRVLRSNDYLFVDDNGEPLGPNSVSYRFRCAVIAAGLPIIGVHGLRHTHISALIKDGQDVVTVADRVGHKSPKMTLDVYGHSRLEQQESAVASMARYSRNSKS